MGAPKGHAKYGGRAKGVPNKSTADVRAAIAQIAKNSVGEVEQWLRQIKDPARRVDAFLAMCEYHIPKLGRIELANEAGKQFVVQVVNYSEIRKQLKQENPGATLSDSLSLNLTYDDPAASE